VGGGNVRYPTIRYSCVPEEVGLIQTGVNKKYSHQKCGVIATQHR